MKDKELEVLNIVIYEFVKGGKSMAKILSVANQKGGVAKTTTAVNLGACLSNFGKKVLVVDIDPQGNATSGLGIERLTLTNCIYDVLVNNVPVVNVIKSTEIGNLELVPATIQLAGAEIELVSSMSREKKLKKALKTIVNSYDYILIDCPPSLGLLTLNALTASDGVLIPIQCEYYALEGLGQLMNTIQLVQKHLNKNLEIEGVLLTMFDARTNLSIQVVDEVKKYFKNKVYKTIIPRNVRLSEAPSHGKPIIYYDPRSKGAQVYEEFAKEVMNNG
ncbi:MAG: chromosome partitioning protein [Clostridia bacterium]|nr:chromosome partitioning protein [Clostridia bacterium]